MGENAHSVFVMTVKDRDQSVYIDNIDRTKSYIFDENEDNISNYVVGTSTASNIKLELDEANNSSSNDMEHHLEESSQLEMMSSLGRVFEDTLMEELDSDLLRCNDSDRDTNSFIMQHMDIREPLSKLRQLLELRLRVNLSDYEFCLQDSQMLESHKTLVDQCVQGEGLVQVNLQVRTDQKQINIVDVLKPADDYLITDQVTTAPTPIPPPAPPNKQMSDKVVQWQLDLAYKREQERLRIPADPRQWQVVHVRHWVQWAVRQFNLPNVKLAEWSITGERLYQLTILDFQRMAPNDTNDIFWTHFELLRKMKMVATIKEGGRLEPPVSTQPQPAAPAAIMHRPNLMKQTKVNRTVNVTSQQQPQQQVAVTSTHQARYVHNGPIQLWQFLLEMLTSRDHRHLIAWEGADGEFKLLQPEEVATLWGDRKNKPTMNYEKLSRALRYYYDGDMISKVAGKRFVYKFVCDLRQVLGYSAMELANLVVCGNPRPHQAQNKAH